MGWCGVLLLAVALTSAYSCEKLHPLSEKFHEHINSKQPKWKAGKNFEIEQYDMFKVLANGVKKGNGSIINRKIHNLNDDIPESFDAREAWPECADIIGLIRDQSKCASCWAFAVVEAISDRICIHSNATRKMLVSAQNILTCGDAGGCFGGFPFDAWRDWKNYGIVTGGLYNNTTQGCQSYFLPPCDDPFDCKGEVDTPDCKIVCDDSTLQYKAQKTYGKDVIEIADGEKHIQLEILKNGPVVAIFSVYSDLANYKSGIYHNVVGWAEGVHAVKIIGWGVEDGTKYWLIANSWNENWGENGYLRILRGENEVDIEEYITAAMPDFSRF